MSSKNSFYGFPPVSAREWKQQIQVALKGGDYNELLIWDTPDQIQVKPFYHAEDLKSRSAGKVDSPDTWKIGQLIQAEDTKTALEKALKALENGAESLYFTLASPETDAVSIAKGIDNREIPLHFEVAYLPASFPKQFEALKSTGNGAVFVHCDVIGHLARSGNWHQSMKGDLDAAVSLIQGLKGMHTLSVDSTLYQNAGASRIQQLAYLLAHTNEYLHLLESAGKGTSLPKPIFRVSVDSNYFFEIAKIRALRLLWATLAKEYGFPEECHIIAQPTKRNKTLYEYNTNMLRTTMECMAAVNGGADTVLNLPYDALYHRENEFGDRIGRNQLLILKNECYLGAVSNPADGAYYIETLTGQLAEKALAVFKSIEASGGFLSALKKHSIQKKIRDQAEKEQELFDRGEEVLVGSNAFQNPSDKMKGELEISPFLQIRSEKTLIEPILEKRLAERLERKRLEDE